MSLKRVCNWNGCSVLVDYNNKHCPKHTIELKEKQKEKHNNYKKYRQDRKEQAFYCSDSWIRTRDYIKGKYKGLRLYSYFVLNEIVYCDTVHHIVELKDVNGWELRLDEDNLIPLSDEVHNQVHIWYRERKEEVQKLLRGLKKRWKEMYG